MGSNHSKFSTFYREVGSSQLRESGSSTLNEALYMIALTLPLKLSYNAFPVPPFSSLMKVCKENLNKQPESSFPTQGKSATPQRLNIWEINLQKFYAPFPVPFDPYRLQLTAFCRLEGEQNAHILAFGQLESLIFLLAFLDLATYNRHQSFL